MDIATIIGITLALGSILGGQVLEGGHVGSIMQLTAFIIVIGGTFGAICIQNPLSVVLRGVSMLKLGIMDPKHDNKKTITTIIDLANVSRKQGLLALEGKLKDIHDPFFRKGVQLIVDGTDPKVVHEILEIDVEGQEEEGVTAAKVWEAAGGYAPTVGIIGAVLGLIHVMENLADPSKLGGGIAVAFVATVYGIGAANLFFLPLANKIKFKLKEEAASRTMIIMGLVGLAQGENPRLLQEKLEGYLPESQRTKEEKK
ncbi:MAG: flagellar motor protein [Nitrospirota bacterium]